MSTPSPEEDSQSLAEVIEFTTAKPDVEFITTHEMLVIPTIDSVPLPFAYYSTFDIDGDLPADQLGEFMSEALRLANAHPSFSFDSTVKNCSFNVSFRRKHVLSN